MQAIFLPIRAGAGSGIRPVTSPLLSAAAAGRLARSVAGPPENPREDVGLPVDHVGIGVPPLGDQADVFWNRRMGRAGPLAIYDLVEVFRRLGVRGLQRLLLLSPRAPVSFGKGGGARIVSCSPYAMHGMPTTAEDSRSRGASVS